MVLSNKVLSAALLSALLGHSSAFSTQQSKSLPSVALNLGLSNGEVSRRDAVVGAFGVASILSSNPGVASAAAAPPSAVELERITTGYKGIKYLIANWDAETTTCKENGGECKRNAEPVRKYMGLRSTTDPLFQIEKVFGKVKNMPDLDPDKMEGFFQATEDWNTAMNMSNSMAFISQFGEYNPGGGKDEVLKYLEEARIQVNLSEKALSTILDALDLPVPTEGVKPF